MNPEWLNALVGGSLIGVAVSLMLLLNGRVTGISGILYGLFSPAKNDIAWRWSFILGLVSGGLVLAGVMPDSFVGSLSTPVWTLILAGILVGFGTVLGSGCTSGHGVCGISRLSVRSILATVLFVVAGIASVYFFKSLGLLT